MSATEPSLAEPIADLTRLAQRHRPVGEAERNHQLVTLDWLKSADRPLDRANFTPGHATGSGLVISEDSRIALIFHSKLKLWVQPGGHAEPHETDIRNVAARESSEELGISIDAGAMTLFDLDVHRIAPAGDAPAHLHYDFRFVCEIASEDLNAGSDAVEARWFTRTELGAVGLDPGLKRMADKAVAAGLLAR
jgi:8-oxo-dGTP pyrophosphatase MutT (NUDIX family)